MTLKGSTRMVLLIGNYAIKVPRTDSLKAFFRGMVINVRESRYCAIPIDCICPIIAYDAFGFFLIMPRVEPLSDKQWQSFSFPNAYILNIPIERKNFGLLNGKIVAVNFGTNDGKF